MEKALTRAFCLMLLNTFTFKNLRGGPKHNNTIDVKLGHLSAKIIVDGRDLW